MRCPRSNPTLAGAAKTTVGKMEHDLRSLPFQGDPGSQAARRHPEAAYTRAQSQIFPLGHPQERTLGVVFFLNRYGPAVVERLLQELPLEIGAPLDFDNLNIRPRVPANRLDSFAVSRWAGPSARPCST